MAVMNDLQPFFARRGCRQWFDQSGWFDRKELSFRQIIDLTFVGSMGPPGGGKQIITPRFIRHFNVIGYVEMSDSSKAMIFNTILGNFLNGFDQSTQRLCEPIVNSTIDVFNTIIEQLLPTPSKRLVPYPKPEDVHSLSHLEVC